MSDLTFMNQLFRCTHAQLKVICKELCIGIEKRKRDTVNNIMGRKDKRELLEKVMEYRPAVEFAAYREMMMHRWEKVN